MCWKVVVGSALSVIVGCNSTAAEAETDATNTSAPKADDVTSSGAPPVTSSGSTEPSSSGSGIAGSSETGSSGSGSTGTSASSGSSTGAVSCPKTVVLMGYWPPSNEMLRPFSTDPALNPGGWQGENWRGLGFDVHAFFPEFPPDGDPSNDPIGSPGSVGSETSDLQVDYQDTSADFWAIVDELQPHIVITNSRGGAIGWEVEAVEGGHGGGGPDPAQDWISDGYGAQTLPTQDTVDPRSWAAMTTYRDETAPSSLPLRAIEAAANALGVTSVDIDTTGTSGNYLSGFLGLHGIYYAQTTPHAVAGGHVHVGITLPVADAAALTEATLEAVLQAHPAESLDCAPQR